MSYKNFVKDRYSQGQVIPWWKGAVKRDDYRFTILVAPLGFNVLFGFMVVLHRIITIGFIDVIRFYDKKIKLRSE